MKVEKRLLYIQTLLMLVVSVLIVVGVFIIGNGDFDEEKLGVGLIIFLAALVALYGLIALVGFINLVITTLHLYRGETYQLGKDVFNVKLLSIPFYITNFLFWLIIVTAALNPFLMIAIPIIVAIGVGVTWFIMFTTSAPNIVRVIQKIFDKNQTINTYEIVGLVFSFMFVLDIVGSLILRNKD